MRGKAVDVAVERDGGDLLPLLVVDEGTDLVGREASLAHQPRPCLYPSHFCLLTCLNGAQQSSGCTR